MSMLWWQRGTRGKARPVRTKSQIEFPGFYQFDGLENALQVKKSSVRSVSQSSAAHCLFLSSAQVQNSLADKVVSWYFDIKNFSHR